MILVTGLRQIATLFLVAFIIGVVATAALAAHTRSSPRGRVGGSSTIGATCPVRGQSSKQANTAAG